MRKIIVTITIIFGMIRMAGAVGSMTEVYLNPVGGSDSNAGTLTYPVQSWDRALQLAADEATIYMAWGAVAITSDMTIDGSQYGSTNITVAQNPGYTGLLFAIADGATGTFSNVTLKGTGDPYPLITVNGGGTLTIGTGVGMTDGGEIAMDGGANPIKLTATPAPGMTFPILTTYQNATDEGREIVDAGSVTDPLHYFTLMAPVSTGSAAYELGEEGAFICLYERPVAGIYLDPLNGNDTNSGAKSNRAVKTLAKAMDIWDDRHLIVPGIPIQILTRVTLTENLTLDDGIKFVRFVRDADRSTDMTDHLFVYTGYEVIINNATIDNGTPGGNALYSESAGKLTLNNGATLTSKNSGYLIYTTTSGVTVINEGATLTNTGSGNSIYNYNSSTLTINGGTITQNAGSYCIYNYSSSTLTINSGTITQNGGSYCIYNYSNSTTTIHDVSITTKASYHAIYNYGTLTMNGGSIENQSTSNVNSYYTVYNASGTITINGGTINGGLLPALGNGTGTSVANPGVTINGGTLSSTNTVNGTVYASYHLAVNGEHAVINGTIYMAATNLDQYYMTIKNSVVTQNYTLRVKDGCTYAAVVRSTPSIDLGPYESKFTLEPMENYALMAYAQKNEGNKNMVLYNPNGIYVNDYMGSDSNSGTTPVAPVKTLPVAAGKITADKSKIYVCDSTLVINSAQQISFSAPKDTILPYLFRNSAYMLGIKTGGDLELTNVTLTGGNIANFAGAIRVDDGTLTLNNGTSLYTYSYNSTHRYGVYQAGGNVTMESGSKIDCSLTTTSSYGYGVYQTGASSILTLNDGALIERQYRAIQVMGGGVANIGKATIRDCRYTNDARVLYVSNGQLNIDGAIIQGNSNYTLYATGVNSVINMTDGEITENYYSNTSTTAYQGAVYIQSQATFNFSGGVIKDNNTPPATNKSVYGEQVYLTSGGKMNFTGGEIAATQSDRNAIYVHASGTTATTSARLTLGNNANLSSGFIYCSTPYFASITLSEPLDPAKQFNINLGDNMAGRVLVDGTSAGTIPSSVNNFILNPDPDLSTLSLDQRDNDVVVGSTAIYLDGVNGLDTNDGSSAAMAVKTFKRARERLLATGRDVIIVIGEARLANTDEISDWDLSFNPDAVIQRGLGYTGYLVNIPTGKSLTLSDITIDGNKDNFTTNTSAAIYNYYGTLTINEGAIIKENRGDGIDSYYGSVYMTGGSVQGHTNYGIYTSSTLNRSDEFIMTGGSITENTLDGITNYYTDIRLFGGEVSKNGRYGIYYYAVEGCVMEISGTAKISENANRGINPYTSSAGYILDSLIISGGEISNNAGVGGYVYANHVSITGGSIYGNSTGGLYAYALSSHAGSTFSMTGGEITGNKGYGITTSTYSDFSMTGGVVSNNTGLGVSAGVSSTASNTTASVSGVTISGNGSYGLGFSYYTNMFVEDTEISRNSSYGLYVVSSTITNQGKLTMTSGTIDSNGSYGVYVNSSYLTYDLSGDVQITNNKNCGIYSNSLLPCFISGNVLIKGNKAASGGGLYVVNGSVNISENVVFEADTCTTNGGAIYVPAAGSVDISGNVQIKDCHNARTSASASYGGSAIYALGRLRMTSGSITGCEAPNSGGAVYVSGVNSNVTLTGVKINDNMARYGGAVYVNTGGRITLDSDTITDNTSSYLTSYATPTTGNIHIAGSSTGRLTIRDKCSIEGDFYLAAQTDTIYIDEALLNAEIGEFHLLGYTTNGTNAVMTLGTVVVSPNGTTVTDASQFLSRFTLMNANTGRGLDKGGTGDRHIMIVNQFFIDGTKPAGGSGSNPLTAFNKFSDLTTKNILTSPYTTVWVSGPVFVTGNDVLPVITTNNVNLRRYTGFAVAAQPFPSYDSVMVTIDPDASLTIRGGSTAANRFTISGEGGSGLSDASIFKNNGTLTIGGFTYLYFNPTGGNGGAINQNGVLNMSGTVDFEMYSTNTVYLAKDKVINIAGTFTPPNPIGITVETSPTNTQIPGRVVVTGSATNIPVGMEANFYNELAPPNLPIGRSVTGIMADLMFYIADRNVTGVPIYTTLQDAFDAAVPADNDEVRLYGDTEETILVDKTLRYNSQGFSVDGSFTLDSTSQVQLLDDLLADTLFIRSNVFSKKTQLDRNGHGLTLDKAAYLDYRLPSDASMSDWYPVNLPFNANVSAIRDVADTTQQLLYLQDYAIAAFDGQRRASFGIGNQPSNPENDWQNFTDAQMQTGTGYMVTTRGIGTLRFRAADLNLFSVETVPMMYHVGGAAPIHHGLNYLAQPMGINSTIGADIPSGGIIQVSESLSSDRIGAASYVAKTAGTSVVAPYTNYFYQTNATGTVSYAKSALAATVRSGTLGDSRFDRPAYRETSSEVPSYYEMRIYEADPERYDALFVAASEYASKDQYEIGRDVVRVGTTGSGMQLWSKDFDVDLCANEVVLSNGSADIPMYVHTPVSGREYTLRLANVVNQSDELWLCRDKKPVQNMSELPEYVIEGTGGTSDEYSLRLLSNGTGNDGLPGEVYVSTEKNRIVIIGLPLGGEYMIYDMSGRLFRKGRSEGEDRIREYAMSGVYVVRIDGKTYKAVVK